MATSPRWKVYDRDGNYQAACRELAAAAALIAFYGDGATLRFEHAFVLWREGSENTTAARDPGAFARIVEGRLRARHEAGIAAVRGR